MYRINDPFLYFEDLNGVPLNNGYIYFGVAGANPETSPITVYYDEAGTQPAAQPRISGAQWISGSIIH